MNKKIIFLIIGLAISTAFFVKIQPASAATITVTSPNGGEQWLTGSTHNITWTYTGSFSSVGLTLMQNGTAVLSIGTVANNGSYSWTVPSGYTGYGFKVRIVNMSDYSVFDESNASFSIEVSATPSITVISPNGGEKWEIGKSYEIKFSVSNSFTAGSLVLVDFANNTTGIHQTLATIDTPTAGTNTWLWQIPSTIALGQYRIVVQCGVNSACYMDSSDTAFNIVAAGTPSITVTSPNGGERWIAGNTYNISWTAQNITGGYGVNLLKPDGFLYTGLVVDSRTASVNFPFPTTIPSGQYKIEVFSPRAGVSSNDPNYKLASDTSDNVFNIINPSVPSITVTSPNGGEQWTKGESKNITWQGGPTDFKNDIRLINVQNLPTSDSLSGYAYYTLKSANNLSGSSNSFTWVVGDKDCLSTCLGTEKQSIPPGKYVVRIITSNGTYDSSNASFEIVASAATSSFSISPTSVYFGETYTFNGKIAGGAVNSNIYFYLQRPDGTMKYENYSIGTTDSLGVFSGQTIQSLTTGQTGIYQSWIKINGVESNKVSVVASSKPAVCFPDGTLIKLPNDPKVYVIVNCQKKWIQTAEEFKEEDYKWSDVKETSSPVLQAYADYLQAAANLLRAIGQTRVYKVVNDKLLWVPTISAFNAQGLKWSDVQNVSESEVNKYQRAKLLKATDDPKVYYITESGLKRHIPNEQVFNSYNNQWQDVVQVSSAELNAYSDNNLIKQEGDYKVYKLENGQKRWVKTAEAFNRSKYDWNKVTPVNSTEITAYAEGASIE